MANDDTLMEKRARVAFEVFQTIKWLEGGCAGSGSVPNVGSK
jgi:hypothetical protein